MPPAPILAALAAQTLNTKAKQIQSRSTSDVRGRTTKSRYLVVWSSKAIKWQEKILGIRNSWQTLLTCQPCDACSRCLLAVHRLSNPKQSSFKGEGCPTSPFLAVQLHCTSGRSSAVAACPRSCMIDALRFTVQFSTTFILHMSRAWCNWNGKEGIDQAQQPKIV